MAGLIVHEWLEKHGGAEEVVSEFRNIFPDSKLLALWKDNSDARWRDAEVTVLQRLSSHLPKAALLPLMPSVWANAAKGMDFEWMLVSSHLFAHQIQMPKANVLSPKYVYVHSPARYLWEPEVDGRANKSVRRAAIPPLRSLDRALACREASKVAANSNFVKNRISRAWGLEAEVIYPPVNVLGIESGLPALGADELETLDALPESFLVFASRLVPYKRLDLAIEVAHKCNQPLVVIGQGPMMASAQAKALQLGAEVIFLGFVSRRLMISVIRLAQAMIFPAIEDFGILPVEAMALGTPVLASCIGGTTETVKHGVSGFLTDFKDPHEAARLVEKCKVLDRQSVQETAKKFDKQNFSNSIVEWMGVA